MRGFSLLEMLVVLVLMGLAAGLVAPSLSRTADRVGEAGSRDDVRRGLMGLPALARQRGEGLRVPAGEPVDIPGRPWPEGWQVTAATPVSVAATGWCAPALVRVRGPSSEWTLALAAPDCRVEDPDAT